MLKMFGNTNVDDHYVQTHYNTLRDKVGTCHLQDWQSPTVIDMHNIITKSICDQCGMPWIGINDIMGVMWDRASDWHHYLDVSLWK